MKVVSIVSIIFKMKIEKSSFIQYLLSVVFIASGITKLMSIDDFQIFIYSLNIISFNLSMILARIIIGIELSIGLLYLIRIFPKSISYITLGLMIIFTLFTLYLEISKSVEDCHCFGTIIQFSNAATIFKNIIIIFLVVFSLKNNKQRKFKYTIIILGSCLFLGFGASLIVRPPDLIFSKRIQTDKYYHRPSFDKFIVNHNLRNQKRIICFLSPKCNYCKLVAKRISIISEKANNTNNILYVFWKTNNDTTDFFKETKTHIFDSQNMDVIEFLKLTNGTMPLIILYNNGVIEKAFRYKDLDENQLINFLTKQHIINETPKKQTNAFKLRTRYRS